MGCCGSLPFDPQDSSVALSDLTPPRPREMDGFADVSLDSHSESEGQCQEDTQPVFLMNVGLVSASCGLYKERSFSVVGDFFHGNIKSEHQFASTHKPSSSVSAVLV